MDPKVEIRVQSALRRIEIAQSELFQACQDLVAITGAHSEWNKAWKIRESCKRLWHALHGKNRAKWKMNPFSNG